MLLLNTMLWPDEVRTPDFGFLDEDIKVRPPELAMASSLIDSMTGEFEPDAFTDDYRAALQEVIDAKVEGREVVAAGGGRGGAGRRGGPDGRAEGVGGAGPGGPRRGSRPGGGAGEPTPDLVGPVGQEGGREKAARPAKKAAAKKTAAKKAAEPAKKTAAKKTAAKKAAPAKKTAAEEDRAAQDRLTDGQGPDGSAGRVSTADR